MRDHIITLAAVLILLAIYLFPAVVVPFILMLVLNALGYGVGFGTCLLAVYLFRWGIKQIVKHKKSE